MKLVLNTVAEPHFAALYADDGALIEIAKWEKHREDGQQIYALLERHKAPKLTWAGCVTGPGGFSSIRAACLICGVLADGAARGVTAMAWGNSLAKTYALNTFGQRVFVGVGDEITLTNLDEIVPALTFAGFLPEAKKAHFNNPIRISFDAQMAALYPLLEAAPNQKMLEPYYYYEAVETSTSAPPKP